MKETLETAPGLSSTSMEETLLRLARECIAEGPGFAQEMVVLREAAEQLRLGDDLKQQQRLLAAWQNLFRSGKLFWGHDVDNPSAPFFHLPVD